MDRRRWGPDCDLHPPLMLIQLSLQNIFTRRRESVEAQAQMVLQFSL